VESGFLTTNYGLLVPVTAGSARRTYANPKAPLAQYPKLFVDRITIWRGIEQKEPVESADFQRVVDDLYSVTTRAFGQTFELADAPGPSVGRLRIALVAIADPDGPLDVYVSAGSPTVYESDEPLPPGLREFGRAAWVEAEMVDTTTNTTLIAVVDRVADVMPRPRPIENWSELHAAFAAWAEQAAQRLVDAGKRQS
jgi:hypothetical protein